MSTRLRAALFALLPALSPLAAAQTAPPGPRKVAILVYPGVELLDFAGPGEVFASARGPNGRAFEVFTVAETTEPLVSQGFLDITPRYSFADCPRPDITVLPGGNVPLESDAVVEWVRDVARTDEVTLSVCNGALLLAKAELLDGREVTTHRSALALLAALAPEATVYSNRRFVDTGEVVTSAGVSAGIDGSLHVVSRLLGVDAADRTARYMEYEWRPDEIAALHAQPGEQVGTARDLMERLRAIGPRGVLAAGDELPPELEVNSEAYALLQADELQDAGLLFTLNRLAHPESANVYDSLADWMEAMGDREEAASLSREALARLDTDTEITDEWRARVYEAATERLERLGQTDGGPDGRTWVCPPCGADCHDRTYDRPGRCLVCNMRLMPLAQERGSGESEPGDAAEAAAPPLEGEVGATRPEPASAGPAGAEAERTASGAGTPARDPIDGVAQAAQAGEVELALARFIAIADSNYRTPSLVLSDERLAALRADPAIRSEVRGVLSSNARESDVTLVAPDEPGERLEVCGHVTSKASGAPLPGARIYAYHTDAEGVYDPVHGNSNPRLFGYARTDEEGRFTLRTIVPASYPGTRVSRHVHYTLSLPGFRTVTAEFLFDDDPLLTPAVRANAERNGWPVVEVTDAAAGGKRCELVLELAPSGD